MGKGTGELPKECSSPKSLTREKTAGSVRLSPMRNTVDLEEFEALEKLAQDHRGHHWCKAIFKLSHEVVEVHGHQLVYDVHVSCCVDGLEMSDDVGRV